MLRVIIPACMFALLAMSGRANAQAAAPAQQSEHSRSAAFSSGLVGLWKSAPAEMQLTSAFDESVWGKNARSVRTVQLQVSPSGQGTLTVTNKVVDARGRTVAGSTSLEQMTIAIGGSRNTISTRIEHDVKVGRAVRTYPDVPGDTWELTGVRVQLVTFADGDRDTLEVRVDTPEGRGSFWETLRHDVRTPARRTSERSSARSSRQPEKL